MHIIPDSASLRPATEATSVHQGTNMSTTTAMHASSVVAPRRRGRFADQVVVITGASAGVGRSTARAFAREGAKVALIARGQSGLDAARSEIESGGGQAIAIALDVADAQALEDAAERVERELGPIDIWVNNAMVTVFAPVNQIGPDEFKRVTEVTYLGGVYGAMAALKRMRTRSEERRVGKERRC